MKANIENLKEAMRRCAKAHRAEFFDWEETSDQLCIGTSRVPVIMDVRMICEAFYGTFSPFDAEDGYTLIHLGMPFLPEVDEELLNMALPASMAMAA